MAMVYKNRYLNLDTALEIRRNFVEGQEIENANKLMCCRKLHENIAQTMMNTACYRVILRRICPVACNKNRGEALEICILLG